MPIVLMWYYKYLTFYLRYNLASKGATQRTNAAQLNRMTSGNYQNYKAYNCIAPKSLWGDNDDMKVDYPSHPIVLWVDNNLIELLASPMHLWASTPPGNACVYAGSTGRRKDRKGDCNLSKYTGYNYFFDVYGFTVVKVYLNLLIDS